MSKPRLGRGLGMGALFGDDVVEEVTRERKEAQEKKKEEESQAQKEAPFQKKSGTSAKKTPAKDAGTDRVSMVRLSLIVPNEEQPRQNFDEGQLSELAESIKDHGVIQPLIVRKKGDYYEIITGERRWRAAKLAGLEKLPVLVRDYDRQQAAEIALIENVQREDLNPIEEALAYRRLMDEFHLKQEEIAERVSKNRTTITNSLRLLKLSPAVQQMVAEGTLSQGHARAILGIRSAAKQTAMANRVIERKMSVRETEAAVKRLEKESTKKAREEKATEENTKEVLGEIYEELEERLTSALSSKVCIRRKAADKGKIEIEYYSQDELERIVELMESVRS